MIPDVLPFLNSLGGHLSLIVLTYVVAYGYLLRGLSGFCSDDHQGVEKFSDTQHPKTKEVNREYEETVGDKKVKFKHCDFNPHIPFPGSIIRWARLNLGKKFQIIGKDEKDHEIYGYVQSPLRHHIISFVLDLVNSVLVYFFLAKVFSPQLALLTTLLFIVHPVTSMARAWISGIGYLICLFGMMCSFNLVLYFPHEYINFFLVGGLTLISISGLLPGMFNFVFLFWLGHPIPATAALLITCFQGYSSSKTVVDFRVAEFKKQMMGNITFIRPSKFFYIVKTYLYYFKMNLFPKRLGLFHTQYYHQDPTVERPDREFWRGVLAFVALGGLFYYGDFPVRFGIVWFLAYQSIFSNIITAMQSVSERYTFIPNLGFCLVIAYYLLPYPILSALLIGIYLMRTWAHLPTFNSETQFYWSNFFNFPDSEVALGNLGVTYMNGGYPGMAVDTWLMASRINPDYDVPWYNLFSAFRQQGRLFEAREYIARCLNAKTVHFPDVWLKDKENIDRMINLYQPINLKITQLNQSHKEAFCESRSTLSNG